MKPTPSQQELIEQTLRTVLKFKDTYDEVYDHILSSLEAMPDEVDFTDSLHHIIEHELGGANGIKAIERKHVKLALREYIKEYLLDFVEPLISLYILPLALIVGLFWFFVNSGQLDEVGITIIVGFGPLLFMGGVLIYYLRKKKLWLLNLVPYIGYIRQNMMAFSSIWFFFPTLLLTTTRLICLKLRYHDIPNAISTAIFLVVCLHTFACCKMHLDKRNFQTTT